MARDSKTSALSGLFAAFALFAFSACFARAEVSAQNLSGAALKPLAESFRAGLAKCGAKSGAVCAAARGRIIFGADFSEGSGRVYPLGNTSQPLLSLMLAAMESGGELAADWRVARHCSYFKPADSPATFDDLLSMRAGFEPYADSLVPPDAAAFEFFGIAAQLPRAANGFFARSRASAALAGYAMAYVSDKKSRNLKKAFAACAKKYLFEPLEFSSPRFASFDKPDFPATAFALTVPDCAKWLECETADSPKIATRAALDSRRNPRDSDCKFGGGWTSSTECGVSFRVSADYFEGCANVVAVFPAERVAVAFFAASRDAKGAAKLCADSLSQFVKILSNAQ